MKDPEKIKEIIAGVLSRMGIVFEEISVVTNETAGHTAFIVKTAESGLLIGTRGAHISALNHLIKRIAGKNFGTEGERLNFYVDINDYHDRLANEIKNKSQILAERARSFKSNVEMEPMSSYERMIVHSFFESSPDIKTESRGQGESRRIILKYIGEDSF